MNSRIWAINAVLNESAVSSLIRTVCVNCDSFSLESKIFWPCILITSEEKFAPNVGVSTVLSEKSCAGSCLSEEHTTQLSVTSSTIRPYPGL